MDGDDQPAAAQISLIEIPLDHAPGGGHSSGGVSPIHSFQSRDRLEDSEGKTSIELQHKCQFFICFKAANI